MTFTKGRMRRYEGEFKNGKFEGYGEVTYKNGRVWKGWWKNNVQNHIMTQAKRKQQKGGDQKEQGVQGQPDTGKRKFFVEKIAEEDEEEGSED